jgi:hypothetical protein
MLQLIYTLKKHNNWRFPTPSQPRISFEGAILSAMAIYTVRSIKK